MTNTTTEPLTIKTITDAQIEALAVEAREHGDMTLADSAHYALKGSEGARARCVDAINAARAMVD